MILYTKTFSLGKGISFARYIKTLHEELFPDYVLLLEKTSSTNNYCAEIIFSAPPWTGGVSNVFPGRILFNKCTIEYSKEEQAITIQASPGIGSLLMALFYIVLALIVFLGMLCAMAAHNTFSLGNLILPIVIAFIILVPVLSTYIRDANFLDRIGLLGSELNKE